MTKDAALEFAESALNALIVTNTRDDHYYRKAMLQEESAMTKTFNEEQERARFEAWFSSTRTEKRPDRVGTRFDRMEGGDYVHDHTQRHWWTWQNAGKRNTTPSADQATQPAEAMALLRDLATHDTYESEYDGRVETLCHGCSLPHGEHEEDCDYAKAHRYLTSVLGSGWNDPPPKAPSPDDRVECSDCGKFFNRIGLRQHRKAKHPTHPAPASASEPRPPTRDCSCSGCMSYFAGNPISASDGAVYASASVAGAGEALKEKLTDIIAAALAGTYHCTRVWQAWHVGTMSEDDFEPVDESDTPAEIADAVIAALAARPVADEPPTREQVEAEALHAAANSQVGRPVADGEANSEEDRLLNLGAYVRAMQFVQSFHKDEAEMNGDPDFEPPAPADWIVLAVMEAYSRGLRAALARQAPAPLSQAVPEGTGSGGPDSCGGPTK